MLTNDYILQVFIPFVDKSREKGPKVLLLLDGHESLQAIELAAANGVEIFALTPHMTHILQPMDVGFFSSLKLNWNKAQEEHCQDKNTKNQFVTKENFCSVLEPAWVRTVNPEGQKLEEAGVPGIRNSFK